MSIDAEQSEIRTVIVGALVGHLEAHERGVDALFAMRQAEAIVKALKIAGYEIRPLIEARTTTCCRLTRSPVCCSGDRQANGFKGSMEFLPQCSVMMIQGGGDFGWPATGTEDASQ